MIVTVFIYDPEEIEVSVEITIYSQNGKYKKNLSRVKTGTWKFSLLRSTFTLSPFTIMGNLKVEGGRVESKNSARYSWSYLFILPGRCQSEQSVCNISEQSCNNTDGEPKITLSLLENLAIPVMKIRWNTDIRWIPRLRIDQRGWLPSPLEFTQASRWFLTYFLHLLVIKFNPDLM